MATSTLLPVFACIVGLFLGLSYSMKTEITPEKATSTVTTAATISCFPDDVNGDAQSVESIEINKDGAQLIALVRTCSKPDCTLTSSSDVKAVGAVDMDIGKSYLKATLSNPTTNDTGSYSCGMHYLDANNLIKEDKDEKMFTVEDMTAADLEPVLKNLTDRVEILEAITNPSGAPTPLGQATGPAGFQNPDCYSAFAVLNNKDYKAKKNTIMILPDVIFSKGKGYDAFTGVFKAPCPGIYNFNLAIAMKGTQSGTIVTLKKNADVVLRIYAADRSYDDQSSGSVVLYLQTGDSVFAYIAAVQGSETFDSKGYTVFSGYLAMRIE